MAAGEIDDPDDVLPSDARKAEETAKQKAATDVIVFEKAIGSKRKKGSAAKDPHSTVAERKKEGIIFFFKTGRGPPPHCFHLVIFLTFYTFYCFYFRFVIFKGFFTFFN